MPEAINEDDLPLTLPETDNFKPSGSPESPLANIREWVEFTDPRTGVHKQKVMLMALSNVLVAIVMTHAIARDMCSEA